MAINFRRRIKIAPGVYLNVGRAGVSTSIGARGASITVGKRGAHANLGVPGTGLSTRRSVYTARPESHSVGQDAGAQTAEPRATLRHALLPIAAILAVMLLLWLIVRR